jgi:hypothetical protein
MTKAEARFSCGRKEYKEHQEPLPFPTVAERDTVDP